ncbi:MAG: tRNA (adenosine(37)-N6)-threonylcarbamoyltransferase complex ATPase subunit type 1 TsaE [Chloroflexi bacterium]|nr:tRNA (adenosine(37)-N6)-threonylcarbamoyltransferase complex ATPase subunit type 1 TsaE [Chloroflexota bacterium]
MPVLDDLSLDFLTHSAEQTRRMGVRLGELLKPGDLICLAGELGAGKTCCAAGVGRGWGALEPVTSPTFVLVNEYHRADGLVLHHVDCYRLKDAGEAASFGFADLLASADAMLVEWPERLLPALPAERMWLDFLYVDETKRNLRLKATGARYAALLADFRRAAFGK